MSESEEEDWGEDDEELVVEEMGGDEAEGTGDAEPTEDVDDEANNMRMLAEEAEYEKQDAAARLLQGVVRRGQGRRYAKEYGKQCFIKEWDPEKKQYAYVDTRRSPPSKQWTKPKWLGDDDLVEETRYRAPPNYPKRRQTQRQFALVAHTAEFDDDKVPCSPCVKNDIALVFERILCTLGENIISRCSNCTQCELGVGVIHFRLSVPPQRNT
jgi:hypothetical protein